MRKAIVPILFLSFCFVFLPNRIYAQGLSLGIYPPIIEVQTTPPSSPSIPIQIQNFNDTDADLSIQLIPLKMSPNSTGDVVLMPELLKSGFYGYYKGRIQFLIDGKKTSNLTLQADEKKEIILNINLSKGDPPGDYYYAVVFLSNGQDIEDTSISSIPAGIATNLLLSVGPKKAASGGISEFSTRSFVANGPIEFSLKLHNASKHLINPTGNVTITNMLGKKVAKIDILPQYILAESDRYLIDQSSSGGSNLTSNYVPKIVWKEKFLLGLYSAKAQIRLEENGAVISKNTYFFAFPFYLFFAVVIVVFVTAGIYLRVKKKI